MKGRSKEKRAKSSGASFLNDPVWIRPQAAVRIRVSVWGGAPPRTASLAKHTSADITFYMIIKYRDMWGVEVGRLMRETVEATGVEKFAEKKASLNPPPSMGQKIPSARRHTMKN